MARKLAPKIVSGLVVYTSIKSLFFGNIEFAAILNFNYRPSDLPIQFLCITFT